MTSVFDPSVFLDATTTEINEKRPSIPTENPDDANGLYMAVIGEIKSAGGKTEKGATPGSPWLQMIVPLRLQLPSAVQALGLPAEFTLTDRPFIDLTAQGSIDNGKGKNRAQYNYREATGTNVAGQPWSWRQLQGKTVKVRITHETYQNNIVERVAGVFKA